jgi:DNA polymerase-3 subunit beta
MSHEIKKRDLAAMLLLAAKQDIRYYLNGVLLEIGKTESRLVATNGHIMGVLRLSGTGQFMPGQYIIPRDVIEFFKPTKNGSHTIILSHDGPGNLWSMHDAYTRVTKTFNMIDATFPDYAKVMPNKPVSNTPAQLEVAYLEAFKKANIMLTGQRKFNQLYIGHDKDRAVVNFDDGRFTGVIMGLRPDANDKYYNTPAWASRHAD